MKNRLATVACVVALVASSAIGQTTEERLRQLEEENRRILGRLEASEGRNAELSARLATLAAETDRLKTEERDAVLEQQVAALTANLQETNGWSTATRSGLPIRFYGFLRLDAYYNTARASDPVIPFRVLREGTAATKENDDQFAFDVRLTRFGIDLDAGTIGKADVTGKLEIDFANFPQGSRESRETPRIRLAYIDLTWGNATLRLGQDWDVISPLYPAVHAELLLWGAGNLGDRRPMVQFIWGSDVTSATRLFVEGALGMTGAIDQADNDGTGGTRTLADGFDSGHPHGQLRAGATFDSWVEGQRATVAAWGFVSGLETDTELGGDDHFTPFAVGLDVVVPLIGGLSLRAEAWYGQALSDIRGNILQDINTLTGEEIAGWGGFAELHWQVSDCFRLAVGGSIDDPDDQDLSGLAGEDRSLNWTTYVSSKLDWSGGLVSGLDVIFWETQYSDGEQGNMVRINVWTQLDF